MKGFFGLLALIIVSIASARNLASLDWSNIQFKQSTPSLLPIKDYPQINGKQRIVGGNEAIPYSLPYQVIMLASNPSTVYFCGGSIISANYVLTSASCVYEAKFIEVLIGVHDLTENGEHAISIMAEEFTEHEGWNFTTLANDIGVIKLSRPIQFNEYIQPVKLPRYSDVINDFEDEIAKVSGWGKATDEEQNLSPVLRYVDVPVMNLLNCGSFYFGFITETNICTIGDGGKGFCEGDNGGPLVLNNVQIGVISFNNRSGCEYGFPSVYTRVTSYLDWIEAKTDVVIED